MTVNRWIEQGGETMGECAETFETLETLEECSMKQQPSRFTHN